MRMRKGVLAVLVVTFALSGETKASDDGLDAMFTEAQKRNYHQDPRVVDALNKARVEQVLETFYKAVANEPITDSDRETYFQTHRSEFVRPEYRRVSHILVKTKAEAERIHKTLAEADVAAFAKAAQQLSIDTETKLRGGDLRYFDLKGAPSGEGPWVDEAIARSAFEIKTLGELHPHVITVGPMWSVVKLTGIREARQPSADALRVLIEQRVKLRREQAYTKNKIAELRASMKVKVNPQSWDELSKRPL